MTEYNTFCYSKKYNGNNSFQQERYRAFNKKVNKERYFKILKQIKDILGGDFNLKLNEETWNKGWKRVTDEQWKKLLKIPEAKDFKVGFEFITGIKINFLKQNYERERKKDSIHS